MATPSPIAPIADLQRWDDSARPDWADADERCEACARAAEELAAARKALMDARILLRKISQMTPKATKPEFADTPADCLVLGYVSAFSIIKARIEMFLKGAK